jgi:hypothetical protein
MEADGALAQKLDTLRQINALWADAFSKYQGQMVPSVMLGGASGTSGATGGAQQMMDLLTTKAARDLALELTPKR